jgi:AbrB family looped-hinge helix DNA binding protein
MMARAKITSKGQLTLPKEIRDQLGLEPGDEVEFYVERGQYRLRKVPPPNPFAPWRGFLKEYAGRRSDDLVDEMRGERLDYRD